MSAAKDSLWGDVFLLQVPYADASRDGIEAGCRVAQAARRCRSGSARACGTSGTSRAWRRTTPPCTARRSRGGATGPSGSSLCAPLSAQAPDAQTGRLSTLQSTFATFGINEYNKVLLCDCILCASLHILVLTACVDRCLQGAVAAGLWAATGSQSRRRGAASSFMVAVIGGAFMGAYLMWEFFPGQPALQVRAYAMWLCSLRPASMRVTPTLQAHGRVWVYAKFGAQAIRADSYIKARGLTVLLHVTKLTAYQYCVDAGLWSDNPGSGVPGAAAAAEQGVRNLAALFGSCVGAHAACHLLCAGASPSSVMSCLTNDWPHGH